jgi:SAM-dependent methyltransferase
MIGKQKAGTRINSGKGCATVLAALLIAVLEPFPGRSDFLCAQERDASPYMAPFVPTPHEIVNRMLEIAEIRDGDILYDLGSGDGRIVLAAAGKYRIRAIGFEIDPRLVSESRRAIREAGLDGLAEIREQDVRAVDFASATVVTMYLYPRANLRLRPTLLRQLRPGARVISHDFGMGDWEPDRVERLIDSMGLQRTLYLWRIRHSGPPS